MKTETLGLVVGGLLPAVMFALSGVLQKVSSNTGIGLGPFLIATGLAIVAVGGIAWLVYPERAVNSAGLLSAFGMGVAWAFGVSAVIVALSRFTIPLSKLVPLYNTNTLLAILISLVIFAEWQQVQTFKLLLGAILIICGSILAAGS